MTSPVLASKGPGGRWYEIPDPIIEGGWRGPSVTTILSNGVPAPALKVWGERQVAEWAYENRDKWALLDKQDAVKLLARAPYNTMTTAGNRGTDIHQIAERILEGVAPDSWEGQLYGKFGQYVQNFLADFEVVPLGWERTVVNIEDGYAGSYDLLCQIDGETWLLDWKTSKGVYGKFGVQLAAYAKCQYQIVNNELVDMPNIDRLGVVHLSESGYRLVPIVADIDQMFETFQAMQIVAGFTVTGERTILGEPIDPIVSDEVRQNLIDRIGALEDRTWLAENWPHNTPGLKEAGHVRWQITAIERVLKIAEQHPPKQDWARIETLRQTKSATAEQETRQNKTEKSKK